MILYGTPYVSIRFHAWNDNISCTEKAWKARMSWFHAWNGIDYVDHLVPRGSWKPLDINQGSPNCLRLFAFICNLFMFEYLSGPFSKL